MVYKGAFAQGTFHGKGSVTVNSHTHKRINAPFSNGGLCTNFVAW